MAIAVLLLPPWFIALNPGPTWEIGIDQAAVYTVAAFMFVAFISSNFGPTNPIGLLRRKPRIFVLGTLLTVVLWCALPIAALAALVAPPDPLVLCLIPAAIAFVFIVTMHIVIRASEPM